MARVGDRDVRDYPVKNRGILRCSLIQPTPTPSSIASSTTRTGLISPATACDARAPTSHQRIDRRATECEKLSASEAPDPGRHHVGTPGDIISECPGDFVGIRTLCVYCHHDHRCHRLRPVSESHHKNRCE